MPQFSRRPLSRDEASAARDLAELAAHVVRVQGGADYRDEHQAIPGRRAPAIGPELPQVAQRVNAALWHCQSPARLPGFGIAPARTDRHTAIDGGIGGVASGLPTRSTSLHKSARSSSVRGPLRIARTNW